MYDRVGLSRRERTERQPQHDVLLAGEERLAHGGIAYLNRHPERVDRIGMGNADLAVRQGGRQDRRLHCDAQIRGAHEGEPVVAVRAHGHGQVHEWPVASVQRSIIPELDIEPDGFADEGRGVDI